MKRSRFTEQQVFAILKEADAGEAVRDVCRRHGVSPATFYVWMSKYGGLEPSGRRAAIAFLVAEHRLSVRRACAAVRLSRATYYRPVWDRDDRDAPVIEALNELVAMYTRWGFWRWWAHQDSLFRSLRELRRAGEPKTRGL